MSRWTHRDETDHVADPKYMANGQPAYWVCFKCRMPLLLDGKAPPLTVPPAKTTDTTEPPMSAQP